MSISIKFFARLREQVGKDSDELKADSVTTAGEAWARATDGAEMPVNTLMAVNMEYVDADTVVADGDEVAFFPPVTGG
ncbi:MAG: molybdopterin converting factor subunit 1 [Gammaproteobacteria bacterium]|nr:molybdopterin converting factor subunit 1 [Gammaproteobacteria bacterium]